MPLATFLLGLVPGFVSRILLALGMSVVTVTGVTAVLTVVKNQFIDHVFALPADMLNLFLLIGGGTALGMMLGAWATRLVMKGIGDSLKFFGGNTGS